MERTIWVMPQWYWDANGEDPEGIVEIGTEQWRRFTDKPLIASGGCWQDKDRETKEWLSSWHTPQEIRRFKKIMQQRNAPWLTFWLYMEKEGSRGRVTDAQKQAVYNLDF